MWGCGGAGGHSGRRHTIHDVLGDLDAGLAGVVGVGKRHEIRVGEHHVPLVLAAFRVRGCPVLGGRAEGILNGGAGVGGLWSWWWWWWVIVVVVVVVVVVSGCVSEWMRERA